MGKIIDHIPDYDGDIDEIPLPGIEPLLENDVRISKNMQLRMDYKGIVILEARSWGSEWWYDHSSSSTSDPVYPMAEVDVLTPSNIDVKDYQNQEIVSGLPGEVDGPVMNSSNYLTYPGA